MSHDRLESLDDLFAKELTDLYSAENQIVEALPDMVEAASSKKLKTALKGHLAVTKKQVKRLEQIAKELELDLDGHECAAMKGLLEEGAELIEHQNGADPAVLDAGLIGAAQRVEHYEIAGYGVAQTFARLLGHRSAVKLLGETLAEEKDADKSLTKLAKSEVNVKAEAAS